MRVYRIPVGDAPIGAVRIKDPTDLKCFAEAIGANYIEFHRICGAPEPRPLLETPILMVDEEAALRSDARINYRASYLFGYKWHGERLRGDALVVWEEQGGGEARFVTLPKHFTIKDLEQMINMRRGN